VAGGLAAEGGDAVGLANAGFGQGAAQDAAGWACLDDGVSVVELDVVLHPAADQVGDAFAHGVLGAHDVGDPDLGEVQTVRSKGAAGWCGPIERPAWWWAWRMPQPPGDLSYRYGWHEDGRLQGFVAFRQEPPADRRWGFDVWVSDFWAATPDALDGLAGLLASDGAFSPRVRFDYGVLPATPDLVWRVGELDVATSGTNAWMLRVVDPRRAIEASGWPVWADLRLELAIQEPGAAARPIVAELAGGSARVEAGGSGRVRIGSGPFSAWFAGGMRAETAARLGLADGPEDDIAIMDQLTADRRPWLPDMF